MTKQPQSFEPAPPVPTQLSATEGKLLEKIQQLAAERTCKVQPLHRRLISTSLGFY